MFQHHGQRHGGSRTLMGQFCVHMKVVIIYIKKKRKALPFLPSSRSMYKSMAVPALQEANLCDDDNTRGNNGDKWRGKEEHNNPSC